jgi:hypothetical protein
MRAIAARGYSLSTLCRGKAAISRAMGEAGVEKRDLPTRTTAVDAMLVGVKGDPLTPLASRRSRPRTCWLSGRA